MASTHGWRIGTIQETAGCHQFASAITTARGFNGYIEAALSAVEQVTLQKSFCACCNARHDGKVRCKSCKQWVDHLEIEKARGICAGCVDDIDIGEDGSCD